MATIKYKEDEQGNKKIIVKTDPETSQQKVSCECCCPPGNQCAYQSFAPDENGCYKYYRRMKVSVLEDMSMGTGSDIVYINGNWYITYEYNATCQQQVLNYGGYENSGDGPSYSQIVSYDDNTLSIYSDGELIRVEPINNPPSVQPYILIGTTIISTTKKQDHFDPSNYCGISDYGSGGAEVSCSFSGTCTYELYDEITPQD
jgi:hypothetical protein